ncbi:hypothetical protein IEQ34_015183 [Dendrobium chrysotoxum]|uniref:Uncharacterized protein n=1 Tax=Dendrobium chrysotoxum TaxID=161865 RepID=A0AAV7GL49_DENCH|nr:hypothetical protein IEQ34_015183 [Dendrobium chrysotoxum]
MTVGFVSFADPDQIISAIEISSSLYQCIPTTRNGVVLAFLYKISHARDHISHCSVLPIFSYYYPTHRTQQTFPFQKPTFILHTSSSSSSLSFAFGFNIHHRFSDPAIGEVINGNKNGLRFSFGQIFLKFSMHAVDKSDYDNIIGALQYLKKMYEGKNIHGLSELFPSV